MLRSFFIGGILLFNFCGVMSPSAPLWLVRKPIMIKTGGEGNA